MTFTTQILVLLLIGWNNFQPIRSTNKNLGSECHQYGISALIAQKSFCKGSSGDLVKRQLFSRARYLGEQLSSSDITAHTLVTGGIQCRCPYCSSSNVLFQKKSILPPWGIFWFELPPLPEIPVWVHTFL